MKHHEDCDVWQAMIASEGPYGDETIQPTDYSCLSECEPQVRMVTGTILLDNGETVEFRLGPDSDARWGNTEDALWHAVGPCYAMWASLQDNGYFESEN